LNGVQIFNELNLR